MFEYADSPLVRYGQYQPGEQEMVAKMINRLRLITGQNFGYDPARTKRAERGRHRRVGAVVQERRPDPVHPRRETARRPGGVDRPPGLGTQIQSGNRGEVHTRRGSTRSPSRRPCSSRLRSLRCETVRRRAGRLREDGGARSATIRTSRPLAIIWQGHVLDLLGKREAAIARYQQVADMGMENRQRHEQYGLVYTPSPYAGERMTTPFIRLENRNDD